MAKKAAKDPNATPSKRDTSAKRRKSVSFGSASDREKVVLIVRKSAALAKKNGMTGLGKEFKDQKALAGSLNSVVKPNGKIEMADEATFDTIKGLAKSALSDLKAGNYSGDVKALLTYVLTELKSRTGGGERGFSTASVASWEL